MLFILEMPVGFGALIKSFKLYFMTHTLIYHGTLFLPVNCKDTLDLLEHVQQYECDILTNSLKETIRYRNSIADLYKRRTSVYNSLCKTRVLNGHSKQWRQAQKKHPRQSGAVKTWEEDLRVFYEEPKDGRLVKSGELITYSLSMQSSVLRRIN